MRGYGLSDVPQGEDAAKARKVLALVPVDLEITTQACALAGLCTITMRGRLLRVGMTLAVDASLLQYRNVFKRCYYSMIGDHFCIHDLQ
jgi:hypothetical protein